MKVYFIVAILLISMVACKKSKKTSNTNNTIVGNWDLVLVTGGLAGIHQTQAQWGHTKPFSFLADNTFTSATDTALSKGTYTYTDQYSAAYQKNVKILYLSIPQDLIVNFAHDTLTLDYNAIVDGTAEWYVRR